MPTRKEQFDHMIAETDHTKDKLFFSAVYLASVKGFANVGIRELCYSVNVKESAFYNHYKGKAQLFDRILKHFDDTTHQVIMTDTEINSHVAAGSVEAFLKANMAKFSALTSNPLYHTILQIVSAEAYTHPIAGDIAKKNLYHIRRGYTEAVFEKMIAAGHMPPCDVQLITAEYYYGLKGMLDEYLLLENWSDSKLAIENRIFSHIHFFAALLQPIAATH
ncbi:TetR/AcrR family transcriptional regulator [Fusibacter paucivorans]|uniref:TetR/AcrR family transcriptional regulator n=1 Tax=Fusibacter paucivorans TaxID=76009 RepID=A0ABS5PMR3_9FIRM|nr:TetR/AcrR family transcriptional regulator [Fusibacter paucivorans]MBS7526353.1 TetR/AcrR family transcriptional regulator [Fusibacter paucivorans]